MSFRVASPSAGALCLAVCLLGVGASPPASEKTPPGRSRTFRFTYAAEVSGLGPGQAARVWMPVPSSGPEQDVKEIERDLPAEGKVSREPRYGNRILFMEARADGAGRIPLRVVYRVTRREVRGGKPAEEDRGQMARLLQPDRLVPITGKPLELLRGKDLPEDQAAAARVIYDVVNGHLRYGKEGTGWGRGDAAWACVSGRGNCSDFHSLFISLARARGIPSRFEIGFPLPRRRGEGEVAGYHCWAWFRPQGKGWVPVDISEANKDPSLRDYYFGNLGEDRVAFSAGRDIDLVPPQAGPPLNFFVQPYVEVGGEEWPAEKVRPGHSFRDEERPPAP